MHTTSPLVPGGETRPVRVIPASHIIHLYRHRLGVDVARFFEGVKTVEVHECVQTGFRFYRPAGLSGDSAFYEALQAFDWYYMPWKWEHSEVLGMLMPGQRVLEIGSGNNRFVKALAERGYDAVGLELNSDSVRSARAEGLNVLDEYIEVHAAAHPEVYDCVCSFQVMEHVEGIRDALQASVDALRPGGMLVISVPNNDAFIRHDLDMTLNLPPHHMNLWGERSLRALAGLFPLQLTDLRFEPLQPYHFAMYHGARFMGLGLGKAGKALTKLTFPLARPWIAKGAASIKGHSILAVYRKTE